MGTSAASQDQSRRFALVAVIVFACVITTASVARADLPRRMERRVAWSVDLNFWPYSFLVTVGFAANISPRIAVAARAGSAFLVAYGAEADARLYLGTGERTLYVFGGGGAVFPMTRSHEDGARLRYGPLCGIGFDATRRTGHYFALYLAVYSPRLCLKSERTCVGGGVAIGRRW